MTSGPPVPFSSLPLNKEDTATHLNAWGAYGPDDELGFLNRQTDDLVAAAAASEIKTGKRINLDAPMDFQGSLVLTAGHHDYHRTSPILQPQTTLDLSRSTNASIYTASKPLFSRQTFQKNVYQKKPRIVHDDTWHFNTQSSTQWDGLRHFGYQKAQRFYNNVTVEDIAGTTERARAHPNILGIQNFAKHCIMGRGVLVDFARWMEESDEGREMVKKDTDGEGFDPLKRCGIKLSWIKKVLESQGTEVKFGDVLFIRSGYMKAYLNIDEGTLQRLYESAPPVLSGVEVTTELLQWIWENFSAVAGDQIGFEQLPMEQPHSAHEVLLAGWGCPIGELFDLEALSEHCQKIGRWSFFLSSEVVNVPGGVASPPNAVAIF